MVRLLTQTLSRYSGQITCRQSRSGYSGGSDYLQTEQVWVQWRVRLLTDRAGLGTVEGQTTPTDKWSGLSGRSDYIPTQKCSEYSGWSDYSHTEMVWVQWVVRSLTQTNALGTVGGQITHTDKWFKYNGWSDYSHTEIVWVYSQRW